MRLAPSPPSQSNRVARRVVQILLSAVTALLLISQIAVAARAQATEDGCNEIAAADLITAASRSDVRGIAEYEIIAENPFSVGKSVAASRRIWGNVTIDRWIVTASKGRCPTTPASELGERFYVLVGADRNASGRSFVQPSESTVSELESGALSSMLGEPVDVGIGSIDRSMAWLRVMWWTISLVAVPLVLIGAVLRRRRANARRDYLF